MQRLHGAMVACLWRLFGLLLNLPQCLIARAFDTIKATLELPHRKMHEIVVAQPEGTTS